MNPTIKKAIEILTPLAEKSDRSGHHLVYCDEQFDDTLYEIQESLNGDSDHSYDLCESCAEKISTILQELATPSIYFPTKEPWACAGNIGYGRDSYSTEAMSCNLCGRGLAYDLIGDDIDSELEHFLEQCPDLDLTPHEAYALLQILEFDDHAEPYEKQIEELATRVVQTAKRKANK